MELCFGAMRLLYPLILLSAIHSAWAQPLFEGNVRIVINSSSTGGDTYLNASLVGNALAEELGVNVKVDAVDTIVAFQELSRVSDGSTLMIGHDQVYLGYLYGRSGYLDVFETFQIGPTLAINPGNAYLARKASPYDSLEEVMLACQRGERIRVAVQAGGVSELGYSALRRSLAIRFPGAERNLVPIFTGAQAEKNHLLFDGQADLINGTIQANEQYTRLDGSDQKAMKFVWLTSRRRTMDQLDLSFLDSDRVDRIIEPAQLAVGRSDGGFNFDKEFFFLYNKAMSPERVELLDTALARIYARGALQAAQLRSSFIPNFQPSEEAREHLVKKASDYKGIIDGQMAAAEDMGELRVAIDFEESHLFFPRIVNALVGGLFVIVLAANWRSIRRRVSEVGSRGYARWLFGDRALFWGIALMTAVYFGSMELIGRAFPNTGLGFLFMSILYLAGLSCALAPKPRSSGLFGVVLSAVVTPTLVWFFMFHVFEITLP